MNTGAPTGWRKVVGFIVGVLVWGIGGTLFVLAFGFMLVTVVAVLFDLSGAW